MKAIFKRSVLFRADGGKKHLVSASTRPQAAPAWIQSTNAFKLGLKVGLITLVNAATPIEPEVAHPEWPNPEADAQGFGVSKAKRNR